LTDGQTHEGFLRWDRNEGSWFDILDAWKEIPEDVYDVWREAWNAGAGPTRTVELQGYRITWEEDDPEFPRSSLIGIRFGHLAALTPLDDVRAEITLKSGRSLTLEGRSSDLGWGMRGLTIADGPGEGRELEFEDIRTIQFGPVPVGRRGQGQRLYGAVLDRSGVETRGFLAWDLDEILTTDVLDGYEDGRDRELPFGDIVTIERHLGGANVTLRSGRTLYLRGTNDVGRGHRGVQVSVPDLGSVEVEWDDLQRVSFEATPEGLAYEAFDGGRPLRGMIRTQAGEELAGRIRWNGHVEETWEFLEGMQDHRLYRIEFGHIRSIQRNDLSGARVVLKDGRALDLDARADVTWDNRGVFVRPDADKTEGEGGTLNEPPWRLVPWEDFAEAWFGDLQPVDRAERGGG